MLGYARVSTDGQSLTAQVAELKAAGCTEIFQEKISGAKTDRKQLAKLISHLGQDDSLVVTRLDRRARSTNYLLNALGGFAEFERELIRSRTTEAERARRLKAW
jgi:DNA invertase Pin-like site-specific DNA recombinase